MDEGHARRGGAARGQTGLRDEATHVADDVEMANDEGADPTSDLKHQNVKSDAKADQISEDDPHKVEKLAKMGDAGEEAAEGVE